MDAATKEDLREWFQSGVEEDYEFMLVMCDTFDWTDFPVYTKGGLKGFKKEFERVKGNKLMEVYNLNMNLEDQMEENRAFHGPPGWSRL